MLETVLSHFNPVVLLGLLVSKTKGYSLPTFKSDKIFSGTSFANRENKYGGLISFSLTLAANNLQSKRIVNSWRRWFRTKICGLTERESRPIRARKLFLRRELSKTNRDKDFVSLVRRSETFVRSVYR